MKEKEINKSNKYYKLNRSFLIGIATKFCIKEINDILYLYDNINTSKSK